MRPFRVEAPTTPLIGIADLRAHCRVDNDEEDSLLESYERAAVDYLDGYSGYLGRCILRQKWAFPLTGSVTRVHLPFPDCRNFAVERETAPGVWATVPEVTWVHDCDLLTLSGLPNDREALHLTCIAGWDATDDVHQNVLQAVRMLVGHWFEFRAVTTSGATPHQVPMAVDALLSPLRNTFV